MLRRPLVIIAAAFAAGAAVYRLMTDARGGSVLAVCCAILGTGLLLLCAEILGQDPLARQKLRRAAGLFLIFFVLGTCRMACSLQQETQFTGMDEETISIQGRIIRAEQKDAEHIYVVLKLNKGAEGCHGAKTFEQEKERILVIVEGMTDLYGSLPGCPVTVSGKISLPERAANPGGFDYEMYLRSRKILSTMQTDQGRITVNGRAAGMWRRIGKITEIKQRYEAIIMENMEADPAAMMCGILFGDDTFLSEELQESFGKNGIGHLLATSGLHTGFVYGILFVLFGRPRDLKGHVPIVICLGTYAALAGFSASVVRAVLMIVVIMVGRIRFRRTDFLTNIALCAMILLIYEPTYLMVSGFQLSFSAVITLAIILPKLEGHFTVEEERDEIEDERAEFFRALFKKSVGMLTGLLALQLGMTPLILKNYHYISISGLFLNTPAIFLAGLIVPAGMIMLPVSLLIPWPSLHAFAFFLIQIPVKLLLGLNGLAAGGRSCIYLPSPPAYVFFAWYGLVIFLFSESGSWLRKKGSKLGTIVFAAILTISIGAGSLVDGACRRADMIFVDVGQGDCAHLKADGGNILFDCGGSDTRDVGKDVLAPYLLSGGVSRVDTVVLSHLHTDHYAGLLTLKEYVPVRSLILSAAYHSLSDEIAVETGVPEERMLFLERGDRVTLFGVEMTVLAPFHRSAQEFAAMAEDPDQENNCSLVIRAEYKGKSFLFTGDISSEMEAILVENDEDGGLASDVLKVAHHGSRFSSSSKFLEAVGASAGVIQVGRHNLYGHPTVEAMERLDLSGSRIFRTDTQGAILVDLDRKEGEWIGTLKGNE